jgi:hypothetical protein
LAVYTNYTTCLTPSTAGFRYFGNMI